MDEPYLLEGGWGPLRQAALHQIMSQLSQVEQFLSVVLHRGRHQLSMQAKGKDRLRLNALLTLHGKHTFNLCVVARMITESRRILAEGRTSDWGGSSASNWDRILRVSRRT